MKLQNLETNSASSTVPSGDRALWATVWRGKVQPKVKMFIWKLCKDILPTRLNKLARTLEEDSRCMICGTGTENSYHATVSCRVARDLRDAMRHHWQLPEEEHWHYTGPDWLLLLLDTCNKVQSDQDCEIPVVAKGKGKQPLVPDRGRLDKEARGLSDGENQGSVGEGWQKPGSGWVKVNVDGSFVEQTGQAGVGVIARDQEGSVIFTSWRVLFACTSAKEAEARACIEGLRLAAQWCHEPVILESDCAQIVEALRNAGVDRSELCFLIAEARDLAKK
ncbi:hypothetical protein U9M48_021897 [Paspalum notatum var. saurae]|uniref:RNase H type-1 domain-containing protein n=1 Tax=Paspalum notatum var. saurae TaxID=547442 RepID=A0AAQ3WUF4_PASNO